MIGFEYPLMFVLTLFILPITYVIIKKNENYSRIVGSTKILTVLLLGIAAASPFIQAEQQISSQPELNILKDDSRSNTIAQKPEMDFGEVKVREKVIASGNSSDLKSGLLRNIEEDSAYLLESDLQSSSDLKEVVREAREKNASINILKKESEEEAAVSIRGPDSTVPEAENTFTIKTYTTGEEKVPEVKLDGETIEIERQDNNTWSFSQRFSEKGSHRIEASIDSNDEIEENNKYYKTIDVTEKPKILIIGEEEGLGEELEKFYRVDYSQSVPADLSEYYTIISKKEIDESAISDYLAEGNGLIHTGEIPEGNNVLPVKPVDKEEQSEGAKIMLAIDISQSTSSQNSVKKEKQIAYSLADKLPYNNKVGAIAYNQDGFLMADPKPLANNRQSLKDKISRLETGGNSFHHVGLEAAKKRLAGTGNIIMITDGKISNYGRNVNTEGKSERIAENLDVQLITVGVGEDKNRFFLQDLAEKGDGKYYDAEDSGRLNFMFRAGGAEDKLERIVKVDTNHFITRNLPDLSTRASSYEPSKPKKGADLLVTSSGGKTFLTSWRYGLGRVAAFSGGEDDLSRVLRTDPLLVTRAASWSVGDPQRKKDRWLRVEDGRRAENVGVEASYEVDGLKRQGENLYTTEIKPENLGFHSYDTEVYGYNYNSEIEQIGYKEENEFLATETGGKVYTPDEENSIRNDIKSFSERKVIEKQHLGSYLILGALLIFIAEVGYRKRKGKK